MRNLPQPQPISADDVDLRRSGAVRGEGDLRARRRPGRRDVGARMVRQPPQVRSVAIDHVNLEVVVAGRSERDAGAVGRPHRREVLSWRFRELFQRALINIRDEDLRLDAAVGRVGNRTPVRRPGRIDVQRHLRRDPPLVFAVVIGDVDLLDAALLDRVRSSCRRHDPS